MRRPAGDVLLYRLAINTERACVASSAIGFITSAGVQVTGADFGGGRSGQRRS
jgi:hypothetical protein